MEFLSQPQEQLVREQFPSLVNLRTQIHFTYWSELHLVTQELCDQLPFGQIFSATSFYRLIDFQLGSLVTAAQRTLTVTVVSTGTWGPRVWSDRGKSWEPAHRCTIACDCLRLVTFHCLPGRSITSSSCTWFYCSTTVPS